MINGFVNVYKETDFTSHDVVAVLRGIFRQKKIGHTGTLDPMAEGVLPICLGKATRAAELLSDKEKTYVTRMLLGKETDTQDITGEVVAEVPKSKVLALKEEKIRLKAEEFLGPQKQIPPMYSAKKINGKRLYELAREGKVVERKACDITVFELKVLKIELPYVDMEITCSAGTYIRTICHDLGRRLGVGGCMTELTRTRVSTFTAEKAYTLDELRQMKEEGKLLAAVEPVDSAFMNLSEAKASKDADGILHNGGKVQIQRLDLTGIRPGRIRVYDSENEFMGIYYLEGDYYRPCKFFYEVKQ